MIQTNLKDLLPQLPVPPVIPLKQFHQPQSEVVAQLPFHQIKLEDPSYQRRLPSLTRKNKIKIPRRFIKIKMEKRLYVSSYLISKEPLPS